MKKLKDAYIVSAVRTAVGKAKGVFCNTRPDDLLIHVLKGVLKPVPNFDPHLLNDVIIGCAMPEGEQGMNIARISSLLAGLPNSIPAITLNRFCASGLEAIAQAAAQIRLGEADAVIAGGVESMSRIPMGGFKFSANSSIFASNEEHLAIAYGMGITAERVAKIYNMSRETQDAYAFESHQRALKASAEHYFKDEILPFDVVAAVPDLLTGQLNHKIKTVDFDEGPRPGTSLQGLAKLMPAFAKNGSVTAGNSSQMSDGASAVLVVSEAVMNQYNLIPMARFVGYSVVGVAPELMGIGPIEAIPKVLKHCGLNQNAMEWIELNEAFAAQTQAVITQLELDPSTVNPLGGAIALGHPLGASGAIRTTTLLHGLKRVQKKYGLVTMCVGTGMGAAGIFEAL